MEAHYLSVWFFAGWSVAAIASEGFYYVAVWSCTTEWLSAAVRVFIAGWSSSTGGAEWFFAAAWFTALFAERFFSAVWSFSAARGWGAWAGQHLRRLS